MGLTGTPVASPVTISMRTLDQRLPLGTKYWDDVGDEWTYIKAGAAIAAGDACKHQGSALGWDDVRPTAAANEVAVGFNPGTPGTVFALAEFGFIKTEGIGRCKLVAATGTVGLATSGTAGTLGASTAADTAYNSIRAIVAEAGGFGTIHFK